MNILTVENATKSYTERKLLDGTSFYLQEREKVGVIGVNGTGKTTLLRIMAGYEEPDEGNVVKTNNTVIHYLPQDPQFEPEDSVLEGVEKMAAHHATANELVEAKSMMTKLGITDFEQKTKELSGGQRKRLALAAVLLNHCDILILDEPTNHLDSGMAEWLENHLKKFRGALVMVTHDRYFLNSVTSRIIEIDDGKIYSYQENYSGFLARKAERESIELAGERKRQSILRKEIAWMQQGAKARSTKQKAHIKRYEDLADQDGIKAEQKLELSSISTRMGKSTIELSDISKSYGDTKLIEDFTYIFLKQDRIGFIGKNGCGKTTLMKIIDGRIKPDAGSVIVGETIKMGYYSQEIELDEQGGIAYMDLTQKLIDYIKNTAEYVRTVDGLISASAMLERFLFLPSQQYSPIGKLSGGERRRLNLLRVLMEAPNVLILDEPTNDLDIQTMTILEDYLDSYDGIVIMVSHDRYFLDRTAKRIFSFEGNGVIRQYEGGYTDYANHKNTEEDITDTSSSRNPSADDTKNEDAAATWTHEKKLRFSYKENKEYESIESDIEKLEEKIQKAEEEMVKSSSDFVRLNALTKEKEEAEVQLSEKLERWEYLEDLAEQIRKQDEEK